jgi:putative membrane protein
MGATEVIHGVSASTVGLMLGVYQQFIVSLRSVDRDAWKDLRKGRFAKAWSHFNGGFLFPLLSGMILGLLLLTRIVAELLAENSIVITSFLFGVIAISGILFLRRIRKRRIAALPFFFAGIAINYFLSLAAPLHTPDHPFFALLAGMCSGFTLLFPGVSSAFILLLIGKYQYIVLSFSELNWLVAILFFAGGLTGLWMASRFMYRIFAEYYDATVALLAGLMLGALNKLWPWRNVLEYAVNGKGDQVPAYDTSILPWRYQALTGKDPEVFLAILMMALGVFLVVLIEKIAAGQKTKI